MKTKIVAALMLIGLSVQQMACKKDVSDGSISVSITDAPADYQEVNVEVIGLEVNHEKEGWLTIPIKAGIYNLLELQNNVTVLLADEVRIPTGAITQMRLILGTNNSLVSTTGTYSLKVPSGAETGLKVNVNQVIAPKGNLQIVLDFDAFASIVVQGNGSFSLKPVIKIKSVIQS